MATSLHSPIKGLFIRMGDDIRVERRGPVIPREASNVAAKAAETFVLSFVQWEDKGRIGIEPLVMINIDVDGLRAKVLMRDVSFAEGMEWRSKNFHQNKFQQKCEEAVRLACGEFGRNVFGRFVYADQERVWKADKEI